MSKRKTQQPTRSHSVQPSRTQSHPDVLDGAVNDKYSGVGNSWDSPRVQEARLRNPHAPGLPPQPTCSLDAPVRTDDGAALAFTFTDRSRIGLKSKCN
jgi:hypothetical protein